MDIYLSEKGIFQKFRGIGTKIAEVEVKVGMVSRGEKAAGYLIPPYLTGILAWWLFHTSYHQNTTQPHHE